MAEAVEPRGLRRGANARLCVSMVAVLWLAGCQSSSVDGSMQGFGKGEACVNDSQDCVAERSSALNALLVDKKNTWIATPPTTESYASGVRMFAFKTRKRQLNCAELATGSKEADNAPSVLRAGSGNKLSPAQISRGLMFASEVSRELKRESARRCSNRGA